MRTPLGSPIPHEDARRNVSGRSVFVDDIPLPPGTLHAVPVISTRARGRCLEVDASAARALPGVQAVLLARDIPGENDAGAAIHDEPLLADGEVFCVGQIVALVVADTREIGLRGAALVRVNCEPLPALLTIEQGIEAGSFIGDPHRIVRGDIDAALASAPHRLQGRFASPWQEHFYLETHCALAVPGSGEDMKIWSSTQNPTEIQVLVARILGWRMHGVVVESPRMGGAFGGKETQGAMFACLAALGAFHTGRPVKLWLDREQDMVIAGHRHPFLTDWELGFDDEGRILALRARLWSNAGWAADLSLPILDRAMFHVDNGYYLPTADISGRVVRTNYPSNTAMRGFGAPQGMLVVEQALDLAAALLGLDPLEIRRRNLYGEAPRDRTPYGDLVPDCRLGRMIDELARDVDLDARHLAVAAFNERNPWLKRGLALTPVKFGISFTQTFLNQAGALVLLYEDGSVQLNHGGTEMGQGLYTKMTQVCAHALGVPREAVRSMPTSTDKVPNTSPTAASSGADLNGQAVRDACETLVARLRPVAANLLGVTPEDAVLGTDHRAGSGPTLPDGASAWAWREDGTRGVSFTQVCHAARFQRVSLSATGYYRTPGILYDRKAGQGRPFHYFAYGVALAEVELNGLSGEWRVLRVEILHDVGDSLSPALDRGQIEGGFVQGLGWLSTEELRWSPRGELLTRGPSTYKIPAVGDVPLDFKVTLLQAATQPETIHGSKAVGEPPLTLAISAWQAVCRAASAFGPPGTHVRVSLPATPEAALEAVELARSRAHAGGDAAPTAR